MSNQKRDPSPSTLRQPTLTVHQLGQPLGHRQTQTRAAIPASFSRSRHPGLNRSNNPTCNALGMPMPSVPDL